MLKGILLLIKKTIEYSVVFLIFYSFGCAKMESLNPSNKYQNLDVALTEATVFILNNTAMSLENNFPQSTCSLAIPQYKICQSVNATDYLATISWAYIDALFPGCTFNNGMTSVYGAWKEIHQNNFCTIPVPIGQSISRQTFENESVTYSMPNNDLVIYNSHGDSNFPFNSMNNLGIQINNNGGTKELLFNTMRLKRLNHVEETLYDFFIKSSLTGNPINPSVFITGALNTNNRSVTGTVYLHSKNKVSVQVGLNNLLWTDNQCCYPKSGVLEYSYFTNSGETMSLNAQAEFTNSCGVVNITTKDNFKTQQVLKECF